MKLAYLLLIYIDYIYHLLVKKRGLLGGLDYINSAINQITLILTALTCQIILLWN